MGNIFKFWKNKDENKQEEVKYNSKVQDVFTKTEDRPSIPQYEPPQRFHITPNNEVNECNAKYKCPYGDSCEHYDTYEQGCVHLAYNQFIEEYKKKENVFKQDYENRLNEINNEKAYLASITENTLNFSFSNFEHLRNSLLLNHNYGVERYEAIKNINKYDLINEYFYRRYIEEDDKIHWKEPISGFNSFNDPTEWKIRRNEFLHKNNIAEIPTIYPVEDLKENFFRKMDENLTEKERLKLKIYSDYKTEHSFDSRKIIELEEFKEYKLKHEELKNAVNEIDTQCKENRFWKTRELIAKQSGFNFSSNLLKTEQDLDKCDTSKIRVDKDGNFANVYVWNERKTKYVKVVKTDGTALYDEYGIAYKTGYEVKDNKIVEIKDKVIVDFRKETLAKTFEPFYPIPKIKKNYIYETFDSTEWGLPDTLDIERN